jgi:hypothetical protein
MTRAANLAAQASNINDSGVAGVPAGGTGLADPGASGNILTSNGTVWTSAAPGSSFVGYQGQVFTSSGTYTVPAGVTAVKVTVIGGGGGGGGASRGNSATSQGKASGGGGGGCAIEWITGLTPSDNIAVTVGTGGAGGVGASNGTAGGTSSFGSFCSATGGIGGGVGSYVFKTTARVPPTGVTVSSASHFEVMAGSSGNITTTALTFSYASTDGAVLNTTVASGQTTNASAILRGLSSSAKLLFTGCEL